VDASTAHAQSWSAIRLYPPVYPDEHLDPGSFVPVARRRRERCDVELKDLNPRFGRRLRLFGNGKTALKGSIGAVRHDGDLTIAEP